MHFIDRHRLGVDIAECSLFHPGGVTPLITLQIRHHACSAQIVLGIEPIGVRLQENLPVTPPDLELVVISLAHLGDKDFPDPRAAQPSHHVTAAVPSVEVTDNAHALGIRGPDSKSRSDDALDRSGVGSEDTVGFEVPPLPEQVQIDLPEHRGKGVGITLLRARSVPVDDLDRVGIRSGRKGRCDLRLKEAIRMDFRERNLLPTVKHDRNGDGTGMENAKGHPLGCIRPHPEQLVRITVPALQQGIEIFRGEERRRQGTA